LTLSRLYEDYAGSADAVTVERYEAVGGMRRVVQTEIDNLLSADPDERAEQLDRLHDAFIPWLATVNPDTDQPMRRVARWADLPEDSHPLLTAFVGRRLLVKGERDGQVVVEVALESLLTHWDELATWIRDEAADLREADALELAAVAWERSGRQADWLFEGARLTGGETLSARPGFGDRLRPAREFLLASRRHANQVLDEKRLAAEAHARSLRRRSQVLAALLVIIVTVAALAVINLQRARSAEQQARQQAQEATGAKLVGQSRAMIGGARLGGDRRAIHQMLAAEALVPGSDPDALLNTLIDTRRLMKIIPTPSDVNDVAISPDGRHILSAGDDHLIRKWDLESGEPVGNPLAGHTDKIYDVECIRDGRWIASAGEDKTVRVWDAETGAVVHVLTGHDRFSIIAFSPDGALLATTNQDGTVRLWDVTTGKQVGEPIRGHDGWVAAVAFSPDGSRLATGGMDGTVRLWHVDSHQPADPPLPSHKGSVTAMEFSPDGRRIASMSYLIGSDPTDPATSADGTRTPPEASQLRITDVDSGRPVVDGLTEFAYGAFDLAFSPDGRRVAIGASDGRIRVRDADNGAAVGSALSGHTGAVSALAYSFYGTRVISGGDRTIHVWAAEPGRAIGTRLPGLAFVGSAPAAVSPDGRTVATRDADNQSDIALWRTDTGELVRTISTGHLGPVSALAWRPDGQAIASADGAHNTVQIWNVQDGDSHGPPLSGPTKTIAGLSFSPDGHHLASRGLDSPWLWDVATSPPRGRALRGDEEFVATVGFSADGQRLITVAPMHRASGDFNAVLETGNVFDSPEVAPSAVRVWNTDTGEPAGSPVTGRGGRAMDFVEREDEVPISAAAISPDGQRILVGTTKALRLHDVATGQPVGEPWIDAAARFRPVGSVAFSPDGAYVVTADIHTSELQLREAQTGRLIGTPIGHTGVVLSVAFTADGNHIVSQGQDGWMLWPGQSLWRDELCAKLTSNMTRAEWDEWVSPTIEYRKACPSLDVTE
jgi:WD40 repeat protein